ncbi:MAG: hypothetical protein GXP08_18225 [Gammaproteobacteria bacterium]|nr:hypothetical protein [Gammaproteobacteria bacterium]
MENTTRLSHDSQSILDQVREKIRLCSIRTEDSYLSWVRRFILLHNNKRHPLGMGENEIKQFLTDLTMNNNVAAATQNLALSAVLFLYRAVLGIEIVDPTRSWQIIGYSEHRRDTNEQMSPVNHTYAVNGSPLVN